MLITSDFTMFPVCIYAATSDGPRQQTKAREGGLANQAVQIQQIRTGHGPNIIRKGNRIVVPRAFADEVRKNNQIIMTTVAIKSVLAKDGQLAGFQLFQVDRGSVVEKMGFKEKDVLLAVNGIPARNLEKNRNALESADQFDLIILRHGKEKGLQVDIR
jgi:type II secretory pathway component PulC